MNQAICIDPDEQLNDMCHKNHVERAYLYEEPAAVPDAEYQPVPNAQYQPVQEEAKSGPVIHVYEENMNEPEAENKKPKVPTIRTVSRILGALARGGMGVMFLCGVADGLIDTTYGLMLTIICIGWGLLHLLQGVAHG